MSQLSEGSQSFIQEVNKKNRKGNKFLIDKYSPKKIVKMVEKISLLEIERLIKNRAITLSEFVSIFLQNIAYNKEDVEYLASGLIDLFKDIKEYEKKFLPSHTTISQTALQNQCDPTVKWELITGYLIDHVIQGTTYQTSMPNKYISNTTTTKFQQIYGSKELDNFSPEVHGGSIQCLRRFAPSKRLIDSYHHNSGIRRVEHAKDIKTLFVLDSIADSIGLYNESSQRIGSIKPKKENHIMDTGILYFSYSKQEKRIGACLQDYTLSFWDQQDNFKFEKCFNQKLDVLQIMIRYIEHCTKWVTVDQRNNLYIWDIENETSEALPRRHFQRITDITEITHLNLMAVCSLDKRIIFWDLTSKVAVQIMKLEGGISVHSMVYIQNFRVMATAQYENNISIWSFEGKDCSLLNKLKGHNAQITSISVLDDTPLIISADEIGYIKTWDIRNSQCIQTIHYDCKSSMHSIVNITDQLFIGVEYRLHWFEFEDKTIVNANGIEQKNISPISVQFNQTFNHLVIVTKSDMRVIDIQTGQTIKIYANLTFEQEGEQPSEITQFQLCDEGRKFVVGDNKGRINTYMYADGAIETINSGHLQEITAILPDPDNGLVLSCGWDSSIVVQKMIGQKVSDEDTDPKEEASDSDPKVESEDKSEVARSQILRTVVNAHFSHEISAVQLSTRLSLIASASHGIVFIWDYETFKILGGLTSDFNDITAIEFLEPFSYIATVDTGGLLTVWGPLSLQASTFLVIPKVFSIQLTKPSENGGSEPLSVNKLVKDYLEEQDFLSNFSTPQDQTHPMFQRMKQSLQESTSFKSPQSIGFIYSDEEGNVHVINIQSLLEKFDLTYKRSEDARKRKQYFAYRLCYLPNNSTFNTLQDITNILTKEYEKKRRGENGSPLKIEDQGDDRDFDLEDTVHFQFQASYEALQVLNVIKTPAKMIVTSANSKVVKIFSLFGESLCILDIDQPLPYKWRIQISTFFQRHAKYIEALEVLKKVANKDFLRNADQLKQKFIPSQQFGEAFDNANSSEVKSAKKIRPKKSQKLIVSESTVEEHGSDLKFFKQDSECLTFQKFLGRIDQQEKIIKQPKNYSLKLMEARKGGSSNFDSDKVFKKSKPLTTTLDTAKIQEHRQSVKQNNQALFSLLDKIEVLVNAPKKLSEKEKKWQGALDEDIQALKKHKEHLKVIEESTLEEKQVANLSARNKMKFNSVLNPNPTADPKMQITVVPSLKQIKKKTLGFSGSQIKLPLAEQTPRSAILAQDQTSSNYQNPNDKSISSYQSEHLIAVFDKSAMINKGFNTERAREGYSMVGRSNQDWLNYAVQKRDPMPSLHKDNMTFLMPETSTSISVINQTASHQSLNGEGRKIRSLIFKELNLKKNFYKKQFPTVSEFQYLQNLQMKDEADIYEPPGFLKGIKDKKGKKKMKIKRIVSVDGRNENAVTSAGLAASKSILMKSGSSTQLPLINQKPYL